MLTLYNPSIVKLLVKLPNLVTLTLIVIIAEDLAGIPVIFQVIVLPLLLRVGPSFTVALM